MIIEASWTNKPFELIALQHIKTFGYFIINISLNFWWWLFCIFLSWHKFLNRYRKSAIKCNSWGFDLKHQNVTHYLMIIYLRLLQSNCEYSENNGCTIFKVILKHNERFILDYQLICEIFQSIRINSCLQRVKETTHQKKMYLYMYISISI